MTKSNKYKDIYNSSELESELELLEEMANIVGMNKAEKENWINSWKEKELTKTIRLIEEERKWLNKVCILWDEASNKEEKIKIQNVIIRAIKKNTLFFFEASMELQNDKEIAIAAVKSHGSCLIKVSKSLQNDKEIVLNAVKQDQWSLKHASEELKNDKEIVLEAIRYDVNVIQHASINIRTDPEIIKKVIKEKGDTLQYLSKEVQDDIRVVLSAVKNRGYALQYASQRLQNDRKLVLKAVRKHGSALSFASKELQSDLKICLIAVKNDGGVLEYISNQTEEICLAAIKEDSNSFRFVKNFTPKIMHYLIKNNIIRKKKKKRLEFMKSNKEIFDAYWISPKGKILGVEITHIQFIIKNPVFFSLPKEYIEEIYKKHNENLGLEGDAREEIMKNLINCKGWIRIRRSNNFWTAQLSNNFTENVIYLKKFAEFMVTKFEISKFTEVRVITDKEKIITSFENILKNEIS